MKPIPPSRGSIADFQSAAEGANITYSCSPGLVPRTQMSAVCTNVTWRPDPATLQCREPGECFALHAIVNLYPGSWWAVAWVGIRLMASHHLIIQFLMIYSMQKLCVKASLVHIVCTCQVPMVSCIVRQNYHRLQFIFWKTALQ